MYSQSWISAAREDKRWASFYKTSLGLLLLMPETLDQGQPHPEHWHQQAEQNQKLWGAWLNCHTCQHQNTASSQTPLTSQADLPHSDAYSFFKYHKIYLPLSIHIASAYSHHLSPGSLHQLPSCSFSHPSPRPLCTATVIFTKCTSGYVPSYLKTLQCRSLFSD